MVESTGHRKTKAAGFTLVELLVVIFLISLLIGILLPTLAAAIQAAKTARTRAFLSDLSTAIEGYRKDQNPPYYPGQPYVRSAATSLIGPAANPAQYTGAQWLVRALLKCPYLPDGQIDPNQSIAGNYLASYSQGMLTDHTVGAGTRKFVFSDQNSDPMPILYYPSRLGNDQTATPTAPPAGSRPRAYCFDDNSFHTAKASTIFCDFVTDKRTSPWKAFRYDSYLLIAAGPDREFLTADDIRNWQPQP